MTAKREGARFVEKHQWTTSEFEEMRKAFEASTGLREGIANHQKKYPHRTKTMIQQKFYAEGVMYGTLFKKTNAQPPLPRVQRESMVHTLEKEVNDLRGKVKTTEEILEIIHCSRKKTHIQTPAWLTPKRQRNLTGIVTLDCSDVHYGEVVKPEAIQYYNEYNRAIAKDRLGFMFKMAVELPLSYFNKPKYDGFVFTLNGDIISGNIHEELETTNDGPITTSVVESIAILKAGIAQLADHYHRVYVPCTVGNHGRTRDKKWFKQRAQDSWEFVIYHMLAEHFKDDERVTVSIADGPDITYRIYGQEILQNHGDEFKGGSGIAGPFTPISLGVYRKQQKQQIIGKPFHRIKIGHWHFYIHTENMVINGSVKGYDEFASILNLKPEPPKQALYIDHPDHGTTFRMPIVCNGYEKKRGDSSVSFFK